MSVHGEGEQLGRRGTGAQTCAWIRWVASVRGDGLAHETPGQPVGSELGRVRCRQ